jgi:uncharacterized membrane protein YedE/YeeE
MKEFGYAELHVKNSMLVATVGGGLVFGVGMALLGYCPGTGVAAIAEGSRHAIWGVLGMLFGAFVLAESYGFAADYIVNHFNYGKATLPELTGVSPWMYWGALTVGSAALFALIERWERRRAGGGRRFSPWGLSAAVQFDRSQISREART